MWRHTKKTQRQKGGGGGVIADLREILGNSVKRRGLGILDPRLSVERVYNNSKASSEVLVGSHLGGTDLNYVVHKGCVLRASGDGRKQQELAEKALLARQKELVDGDVLNCLRQATDNGEQQRMGHG